MTPLAGVWRGSRTVLRCPGLPGKSQLVASMTRRRHHFCLGLRLGPGLDVIWSPVATNQSAEMVMTSNAFGSPQIKFGFPSFVSSPNMSISSSACFSPRAACCRSWCIADQHLNCVDIRTAVTHEVSCEDRFPFSDPSRALSAGLLIASADCRLFQPPSRDSPHSAGQLVNYLLD